MMCKPCICNCR